MYRLHVDFRGYNPQPTNEPQLLTSELMKGQAAAQTSTLLEDHSEEVLQHLVFIANLPRAQLLRSRREASLGVHCPLLGSDSADFLYNLFKLSCR